MIPGRYFGLVDFELLQYRGFWYLAVLTALLA
jgi:hypothetical protein